MKIYEVEYNGEKRYKQRLGLFTGKYEIFSLNADGNKGTGYIFSKKGVLLSKREYKNACGTSWKEFGYYQDGKLSHVANIFICMGGRVYTDSYVEYYPNGQKAFYATDADTFKRGTRTWYYENGKTRLIKNYSCNSLSGKYQKFWPNGKLKLDCRYESDCLVGDVYEYDENGTWIRTRTYLAGNLLKTKTNKQK